MTGLILGLIFIAAKPNQNKYANSSIFISQEKAPMYNVTSLVAEKLLCYLPPGSRLI